MKIESAKALALSATFALGGAAQRVDDYDSERSNERGSPWSDHENRGDVNASREAEAMGVPRIRRAVVARDLDELGQHHGCAQESQRGVRRACCL